jgi:hypothetical protein
MLGAALVVGPHDLDLAAVRAAGPVDPGEHAISCSDR